MERKKQFSLLTIVAGILLLPNFTWAAFPAIVPRTGQTSCSDSLGASLTCAGTGQDGDVQAGAALPVPRFSDRGDNTITDNLTGLVWAENANLLGTTHKNDDADGMPGDGLVTWEHALAFIRNLNRDHYLGHSDWRLPNINELESLVDAERSDPALPVNSPFVNVRSVPAAYYWSSTSWAANPAYAWLIEFYDGYVGPDFKGSNRYVWPVREGQCPSLGNSVLCLPKTGQTLCFDSSGTTVSCAGTGQDGDIQAGVDWPSPRFTDHGSNAVTDILTGLVWAKNANLLGTIDQDNDTDGWPGDGKVYWQHSLNYIKKLNRENYLGYSTWRLPSRRELRSLADHGSANPSLPQFHPFSNVQTNAFDFYFTSTSNAGFTPEAWLFFTLYGRLDPGMKAISLASVWPVTGPFFNLTVKKYGRGFGRTTSTTSSDVMLNEFAESDFNEIDFGRITSSDGKINCGSDCSEAYVLNTVVTLTATDALGSTFEGWSGGGCTGTGTCMVTVTDNVTVIASFQKSSTSASILSGTVVAFDTNAGLENVEISIPFLGVSTVSGPGGSYQLVVPSGQYTVYYRPPFELASQYLPHVQTFAMPAGLVNGDVYLQPVSHTVSTSTTCICVSQKVLGEDSPDLEALRGFRDNTLAQSAFGRRVIKVYYSNSESINAVLGSSPALQAAARKALEAIAMIVQQ